VEYIVSDDLPEQFSKITVKDGAGVTQAVASELAQARAGL